jgi:hypothetical protein
MRTVTLEETITKVLAEKNVLSGRLEEYRKYEKESLEHLQKLPRGVIADSKFIKP